MPFVLTVFAAGFLSFFMPCTLPLVPGFLGVLAGDGDLPPSRRAGAFLLGFLAVFVLLGAAAGTVGSLLRGHEGIILRLGGVILLVHGLSLLRPAGWRFPFQAARSLTGGILALGWTPCIGPVLGTVLLLASAEGSPLRGAFLLLCYGLGLALPFAGLAWLLAAGGKRLRYRPAFLVLNACFLIGLGLLLASGHFDLLVAWCGRLLAPLSLDRLAGRI